MRYLQTKFLMLNVAASLLVSLLMTGCGGGGRSQVPSASTSIGRGSPQSIGNKLSGVNFGQYLNGITNVGDPISSSQLQTELAYVAANFTTVRTFSSTGGMELAPSIAKGLGLRVAAGCWIDGKQSPSQRQQEIANLISNCNSGSVDVAIVGSETLLRGDLKNTQLIAYINQVRSQVPTTVKVTTVDTWNVLINYPDVIASCDEVWVNMYPFWEGVSIQSDTSQLDIDYVKLGDRAGTKKIVISETGWPSSGGAHGSAVPSVPNEAQYFKDFVSWAQGRGVDYCYFEMFDEVGKTQEPGNVDSHWGLWDDSFNLKSGCNAGFNTTASGSGPSFPYTPIANVPQAVNDLGRLIGQQQADVVVPGGNQINPNFSAADQQAFESSGRLTQIVQTVTSTSTFTAGVAAIQGLDASTQSTIYADYQRPDWLTWTMLGGISDQGTTNAGYVVEQEIANALTQAVQQAVSHKSATRYNKTVKFGIRSR